jgi:hypothetical protein
MGDRQAHQRIRPAAEHAIEAAKKLVEGLGKI